MSALRVLITQHHLFCFLCHLPQVKYTQGGLENLELARKYFAQALKLNNRNMRALFGLYMVRCSENRHLIYCFMNVNGCRRYDWFTKWQFRLIFPVFVLEKL